MSKYCDVCSLYLGDDNAFQTHLNGKKHRWKLQKRDNFERSIIVSPLPKGRTRHKFIDTFDSYGNIKWYRFCTNDVIIQFDSSQPIDILLSKPMWIDNTEFTIKRRTEENDPTNKNGDPTTYDKIKDIFEEDGSFDDKLKTFLNAVQLSDYEIETRYNSVCPHLNSIFKSIDPNCKIHKFGSTQMGLGFKECDLDIYMDIGRNESMEQIFNKVKKVLFRYKLYFSHVTPIPKAKTPIIKFQHLRSKVSCDISFMNGLAVHKTSLMNYLIKLDDRIRPLMMLIKYWARHFKISGTGKICNYALVLLTVFYLQQPSVNILPPVMELQKNCEPVNEWQVNFDQGTVLPPATNTKSIPELLHDFFRFYATFEFKSRVICPVDGIAHDESEFLQVDRLPDCMNTYKISAGEENKNKFNLNRPISIQDPIELCHNVTAVTQSSTLNLFIKYCEIGATICAKTSTDAYRDTLKLLLPNVIEQEQYYIAISTPRYYDTLGRQLVGSAIHSKSQLKDEWFPKIYNMLKDIFEKVFKLQVECGTVDTNSKQRKTEDSSDVHTVCYPDIHCRGKHCVWQYRKMGNCILDPSISSLEKEAIISDETIEKNGIAVVLDFSCAFTKKENCRKWPQAVLTLTNFSSNSKTFSEFANFANFKLSYILDGTLIHMLQFKKD